jgi:hypothetical protein
VVVVVVALVVGVADVVVATVVDVAVEALVAAVVVVDREAAVVASVSVLCAQPPTDTRSSANANHVRMTSASV